MKYSTNLYVFAFTLIAALGLSACDTIQESPVIKNETAEAFINTWLNIVNND